MKHTEIRNKIKTYMESRDFAFIDSHPLVPENDPSVLFTTAGVQPLVPYIKGEKHPKGSRIANIQKCIRTQDIEEIGDKTHDTFFEMIGYWYLGKDSIKEFSSIKKAGVYTSYDLYFGKKGLNLDIKKAYITCFAGNDFVQKDEETASYWIELGVDPERIFFLEDNWWSTGAIGPCGPDTEVFYNISNEDLGDMSLEDFKKADDNQKLVEIGNTVFMLHTRTENSLEDLPEQNVDMGSGLERIVMASQGVDSIFETDLFAPLFSFIQNKSKASDIRITRIISDHLRTSVFILKEGVMPSNSGQGYVLRRLIRRMYRFADSVDFQIQDILDSVEKIFEIYDEVYLLSTIKDFILEELKKEILKFQKTLSSGTRQFQKYIESGTINSKDIFNLYTTYGFPLELTYELLDEKNIPYSKKEIEKEIDEHKNTSRTASAGLFKGGLAGNSEIETRYHTATHLLHTALRNKFGTEVMQKGSNINTDRMRFDFTFNRALTKEELGEIEEEINTVIKQSLPVIRHDTTYKEAQNMNAIGLFTDKYGDIVSVYQIGENGNTYSTEICMGPHVKNTQDIGVFKILKEESSSAGVRRIKAILE